MEYRLQRLKDGVNRVLEMPTGEYLSYDYDSPKDEFGHVQEAPVN